MKTTKFEIIAGTYEEFLLGFHFISKQTELVQSFAIHDHSSSIRCVAASGHYLADGAADDRIIVYNLRLRKEHCMLSHHNATVNCLQFTNNHSHLISGSADGELAIVRVGSWQLEKTWAKAHKGSAILDIAIHSSGKLALTLGADCSLRTWNLVKGRQAYAINLNSKSKDARSLNMIVWAEDGVRFILSGGKYTEIWSIETGGILKVIEHDEKICSCIWVSEYQIIVGYEDGQIALIEINECTKNLQKAHDSRVKTLTKYSKWIVSASSNGEIKVWNMELKELSKYNTGCRITCLTVAAPTVKIKEEQDEEVLEIVEVKEKPVKKSSVTVTVEEEGSDNENSEYEAEYDKIKTKKIKNNRTGEVDEHNKIKKKKKRTADGSKERRNEAGKQKKVRKCSDNASEERTYVLSDRDVFGPTKNETQKIKKSKSGGTNNRHSKKKNKQKTN
ncbi:p21-activated protein kinase-interacting protein 1-like [Anoplophora glabripennis]|uniref:p21-activated protein kinase-interacting protein 1-like n=1 Tax=Anoplophora glabripennis TaxID=217634 RepID=UPI000873E5A1|nr:p21-activated protein kinase-interacting protein 1-like [Anoplophora glabripennis]